MESKMNVLIIDDQPNVVSSLKSGVNWADLQIRNIYTALNAQEARAVIQSHPVDILLSDIEMPAESGLSLLRWCRGNGYTCECIFLTSHADFFYAQEAIQLGSFDYILQPARYEDIEKAIRNSILRVQDRQEEKRYIDYGKIAFSQKNHFLKGILNDWLTGREYNLDNIISALQEMNIIFHTETKVSLLLLQILNWTALPLSFSEWSSAAEEIFLNIFSQSRYHILSYCADKVTMSVLVYGDDSAMMSPEVYQTRLNMAFTQISRRLSCSCAIYTAPSSSLSMLSGHAALIQKEKIENILQNPGIFMTTPDGLSRVITHCDIEQIKRFELYMMNHQALRAEQEALFFLLKLNDKNLLNHDTLLAFCRDYQQSAYSAARQLNLFAHSLPTFEDLLQTAAGSFLTLESVSSYLKQLTAFFDTSLTETEATQTSLAKIEAYISDNLEKPLLCSDIAKAMYLSPDYITRLFQKKKGVSLKEYITETKMRAAKDFLITTTLPISLIAAKVGYDNFSHFSRVYKKVMGTTPSSEREGTAPPD